MARQSTSFLWFSAVLCATSPAWADAKRCVAQNNDGVQKRDEHHLLAARTAYRACVAERECPELVRAECDAALTEMKTAIPTLLVAVLDAQHHDLAGATLTLDGSSVPLDGSALEVDPGAHELVAKSGELSAHLQVIAIESDLNRRVEIVLEEPHPAAPEPAAHPPLVRAEPRSLVPAYVLGGLAVAGAASFSYFALSGHAEMGPLDRCKPYCNPDDVRSVRTKYLLADISLGVSVLALAGAGYWLLAQPNEPQARKEAPFSFALTARPGEARLTLRWRN
jgi:hypothetical protein